MKPASFGKALLFFIVLFIILTGCVRFTERDYELQKKAYEKQRQQQEEKDKDSLMLRW